MKQKKRIIGILAILILLTAVLAVVHFSTRDKVPEGALMVTFQDKTTYLALDKLTTAEISGTIVNGKGEEKDVHEKGVRVAEALREAGIDPSAVSLVTVTAADEYSVELSGEEIREDGKAYLAEDGEGGVKLVVFGDANSKRNVRDVVKVTVQ